MVNTEAKKINRRTARPGTHDETKLKRKGKGKIKRREGKRM